MRSDQQYLGVERSLQRAWAKGAGLIDEEFERPMIAVVNTCQDFSPENVHLRQVGDAVKAGIRMAGGTPCEFNTFHVTDSETFASVGMRYVLPSRDLVTDMIELMVEGHRFDAMVLIASGDKVVPGMVMAAARLDLPAIVLYGGPTRAGSTGIERSFWKPCMTASGSTCSASSAPAISGGSKTTTFPFPAPATPRRREIPPACTPKRWDSRFRVVEPFQPGAATNFARRSTPACGSCSSWRKTSAPSSILTSEAFENAMRVGMAVGGSTNMVLHMIAMAKEAGVEVNFDTWTASAARPRPGQAGPVGSVGGD